MVLLKFEGVKPIVLPSNSSETTSTIFSCSGAHIPACKKKYLLVGASGMLWMGGSVSGSVGDLCMSHQSDWIYY